MATIERVRTLATTKDVQGSWSAKSAVPPAVAMSKFAHAADRGLVSTLCTIIGGAHIVFWPRGRSARLPGHGSNDRRFAQLSATRSNVFGMCVRTRRRTSHTRRVFLTESPFLVVPDDEFLVAAQFRNRACRVCLLCGVVVVPSTTPSLFQSVSVVGRGKTMTNLALDHPKRLGRYVVIGYCDIAAAGVRE